ncbi:hypothetical protein [Comamonas antarctica]|uniref:hypothetical protein n=1 Tax=Comamonas antarctica TaxID=2743470 RepID=UPI0028E8065E|nr:hypothetical protein [Comamonas antarctica]
MNDLGELSRQLCALLQSPSRAGPGAPVAGSPAAGVPVAGSPAPCFALENGRWVRWQFQAWQQRWLLGVGCATQLLESATRARLEEALLRVGHASRWGRQQAGLGSSQHAELVDCDFPVRPAQLTAAAVQDQLQALLDQFALLAAGHAAAPGPDMAAESGAAPARGCVCAQAFSERMRALEPGRAPGSIAAQELLFEDQLPLRIALHPRSHHWVLEAFVWDAAALHGTLRQALVSTLLHINRAVIDGRALVCSLDGADRVVVLSRWHPDWAAQASVLDWLDYSLRQARRIRGVCAAIALHEAPAHSGAGRTA